MAHLVKPTYTRPVPAGAQRIKVNGVSCARWVARGGRKVTAPLSKDGTRCTVRVETWYVEYLDHRGRKKRVKAYRDRQASERKLLEIRTRIDRIRAGDLSPAAEGRAGRTLDALLAEWHDGILSEGNGPGHAKMYRNRCNRVLDLAGIAAVGRIEARPVERALAELRTTGRSCGAEGPGINAQTRNHYLRATKAFTAWLVRSGYLAVDPLAHVGMLPTEAEPRLIRRPLAPADFDELIAAARSGPEREGLSGPDRAMLYLVAAHTGFRRAELGSLRKRSFHLAEAPPWVELAARVAKNRKETRQAVPARLLATLRPWLEAKGPGVLWPGRWLKDRYATRMLRADLAAAGIPFLDEDGRRFDFHALRSQFATDLALAGVPIQHAQRLMRHSTPVLTMRHYTRLGLGDLAAQLDKLPSLGADLGAVSDKTGSNGTKGGPDGAAAARSSPPRKPAGKPRNVG